MILIADSGSTKTDWVIVDKLGNETHHQTMGLNPYFIEQIMVYQELSKAFITYRNKVKHIYFYGAGCGTKRNRQIIEDILRQFFTNATSVYVDTDMLGAAKSIFSSNKGIACILGTGANSCVYDGKKIVSNVDSLGYLLTDWGSGAVLGKELVSAFLLKKLPEKVHQAFDEKYKLSKTDLLEGIYRKPMPNRFLASFAPFLKEYEDDEACQEILKDNFKQFFDYYVLNYPQAKEGYPVGFIGSIALHFHKTLEDIALQKNILLKSVSVTPIEGLVKFHHEAKS